MYRTNPFAPDTLGADAFNHRGKKIFQIKLSKVQKSKPVWWVSVSVTLENVN